MAKVSSGSFTTNEYSSRSITFNWSKSSQNIANNYTDINWNLVGSGSKTTGWIQSGNFKVKINDEQLYFSATRINLYNGTVIASGTKRIYHDENGDGSFSAYAEAGINTVAVSVSGSGSWELPTIPRGSLLTSVLNYETDLTIIPIETTTQLEAIFTKHISSYYDKLVLKIGSTVIKTIEGIISPCIFSFTSDEVNNIYNLMPLNSTNLIAELMTYSDSTMATQIGTTSSKIVTATIVNANPIFCDFEYQDVNVNTLALTNDNSKIVKGKSNLKIIISNANMAIGQKGSTIEYYKINDVIYNNYTIVDSVKIYNTTFEQIVNQYSLNNITVYAIDSRNNSTQLIKAITNFINYASIVVTSKNVERLGSINEETNFDFTGTFWNGNFGLIENDMVVTYRYKETSTSSWIIGTSPISITKNDNDLNFSGYLKGDTDVGFGADKSYNVEIILNDKISTEPITYLVENGIPGLDVFKNLLGIHGIYNEAVGGIVQINGVKIAEIVED